MPPSGAGGGSAAGRAIPESEQERAMIEAKQAVHQAMQAMGELYRPEQIPQLLLEEVELSSDERYWRVTLSFARAVTRKSASEARTGQGGGPIYKVLEIDVGTGRVHSMKTRKL